MARIGAVIIGGDFQSLGILRSLAQHSVPMAILDSEPGIARYSRYRKRFIPSPQVRDGQTYLDFLVKLAEEAGLRNWIIYPNNDDTLWFLGKYRKKLQRYYCIPISEWEITKYLFEKKFTYRMAEKLGIPLPETVFPKTLKEAGELELRFPVIIKPSRKQIFYAKTRKKALRIDGRKELLRALEWISSFMGLEEILLQRLIPGGPLNLYSFGSFAVEGEIRARVVAHRLRQHPMDFGQATTFARTVAIPEIEILAEKILRHLGFTGASEIEFMLDPEDGRYKLIEANPRFWGWHSLAIAAGVDIPYLLYQTFAGNDGGAGLRVATFRKNKKWIRLVTDVPTVLREMVSGRMKPGDYYRTICGEGKNFAVFSWSDPLPFLMELLFIPYLWKKRGF